MTFFKALSYSSAEGIVSFVIENYVYQYLSVVVTVKSCYDYMANL